MVGRVGFEPTTNWLKANCSTAELTTRRRAVEMVGRVGFEPTTNWLKANCSTAELTTPSTGRTYY